MTPKQELKFRHNAQKTIETVGDVRTLLKCSSDQPTWEILDTIDCVTDDPTEAVSLVEAIANANDVSGCFSIRFLIRNGQVSEIDGRWDQTDDEYSLTWAECKACGFGQERIRSMLVDVFEKEYAE